MVGSVAGDLGDGDGFGCVGIAGGCWGLQGVAGGYWGLLGLEKL